MEIANQTHIQKKQSLLQFQKFELAKKELQHLKGGKEIIITDIVDV